MAQEYRVVLTKRCSTELHSIHDYIAQDSPQNAAAVVNQLIDAMERLSAFPHRYPVISATRRPPRETRLMPVRPFVVYYRVIESDQVVLILRVEHGARNRPR